MRNYFKLQVKNKASVIIIAMVIMALMGAMAASFAIMTDSGAAKAVAQDKSSQALMSAESGLAHIVRMLREIPVGNGSDAAIMDAVEFRLRAILTDSANLGSGTIVRQPSVITISSISTGPDQYYNATITSIPGGICAAVTGFDGDVKNSAQINLIAQVGHNPVFDFGVASKGSISFSGQASIHGVNNPGEADILSATYSQLEAVNISGQSEIEGDIYTCNPESYVTTKGGSYDIGEIYVGVGMVDFPEIDTSPYVPLATNVYTSGMASPLDNVVIPANTNPTFASDTEIRGVLYIESPNRVKFSSRVDITGVIVTEEAIPGTASIGFSGQVFSAGFDTLPDEPQFETLKSLEGTMMLAPGYDISFSGQSNMLNGALAAESFVFSGQAGGQINGPIIAYGDTEFDLLGQSTLYIDRQQYTDSLPGFVETYMLTPVGSSYEQ